MTTTTEPTILDELKTYLNRFIVFDDPDSALLVALWILHTRTFMESFPRMPWVTPYLYVYSETPGAGKTTAIRVIRPLVYNPEVAGDITSAAMFTLIEESRPTLFVDEVDMVFHASGEGNKAMQRTLNTGYEHSGYAIRKQGREAVKFSTFCAKFLAGIRDTNAELPETVQTRSIPIKLVKGHPKEIYYSFQAGPEAEALSERIDTWIRANGLAIIEYLPKPIESMEPRAFEISMPLLQLARVLGVETETRTALLRFLSPPPRKDTPEIAMLRAIRETFDASGEDKLFTEAILRGLNERLGEGWNGKLLGNRLKQYQLGAPTLLTTKGKTLRGYYRYQFEDAWRKYL